MIDFAKKLSRVCFLAKSFRAYRVYANQYSCVVSDKQAFSVKKQNAKDIDKEVAKAKPNNREEVLDNIDFFWLTIKHQISAALRTANAQ